MLSALFDLLIPPRAEEQRVRRATTEELHALVSPRLVARTDPPTTALLPFEHELVRALIHEAKFASSARASRILGGMLGEYLRTWVLNGGSVVVVPTPLSKKRQRTRGRNQVRAILSQAGLPREVPIEETLLRRVRDTLPQTSLGRDEREKNLVDAFAATAPCSPDTTYILIDDVVTTGATLQEAVRALRSRGALHIVPIALAH